MELLSDHDNNNPRTNGILTTFQSFETFNN